MAFDRDEVSRLLVEVHRRRCICHRYCGTKIETDHIKPRASSMDDTIENAIPLCFECHAEVHSYNPRHPRGRKFLPEELRQHKERWLRTCREHPELFVAAFRTADVGPLQALVDELEYNIVASKQMGQSEMGALLADEQFRRAISHGAIAVLDENLKRTILEAYAAMSRANQRVQALLHIDQRTETQTQRPKHASEALSEAHTSLVDFLRTDGVLE